MRTVCNTIRYHADVYIRTPKYVVPFLALLIFLWGAYGYMPVQVVNSFAFTMSVLFFVMVCVGLTYHDTENTVAEQLLILKLGNAWKHYLAQTVFLFLVGTVFSLFTVLFPLLVNIVTNFALYKRPITASDIISAFVVHCFVAYMGSAVGALFHPRIIKDRKLAMLLAVFVAVVGFTKMGIHQQLPIAAACTWLFPPVSNIADLFTGQETFIARHVAYAVGITTLYGTVINAASIIVLIKKKF